MNDSKIKDRWTAETCGDPAVKRTIFCQYHEDHPDREFLTVKSSEDGTLKTYVPVDSDDFLRYLHSDKPSPFYPKDFSNNH